MIDWRFLKETLGAPHTDKPCQPPFADVGRLAILKHSYGLSDSLWVENPYLQTSSRPPPTPVIDHLEEYHRMRRLFPGALDDFCACWLFQQLLFYKCGEHPIGMVFNDRGEGLGLLLG
jgi:hypothetical protein